MNTPFKVILFGATGMIGKGVLLECLESPQVDAVLAIGRSSCGVIHAKLTEVLHDDFLDYSAIAQQMKGYDACYFCLGISAGGMTEEKYTRITYEFTLAAAQALINLTPEMIFIFVSGAGTDATEKGRMMWARVKGRTENDLRKIPFKAVYLFRPGVIQPMKGITSRTASYRFFYTVFGFLFPLLKLLFPKSITTTVDIGQAMINAVVEGYAKPVLESRDIKLLAISNI